jgi:hypothetical protein
MFSPKISQAKALVRFSRCRAPQEAGREKNYSGFGCSLKPVVVVSGKRSAARGGLTTQANRLGLHGSEKMQNEDDSPTFKVNANGQRAGKRPGLSDLAPASAGTEETGRPAI